MREAWRVVRWRRRHDALSGEGARRLPGRWNIEGLRAVYLAEDVALGVMEAFVHLDRTDAHIPMAVFRVFIPSRIRILEVPERRLPRDWNRNPVSRASQEFGAAWLRSMKSPLLRVPSVLVPHATNLILNPAHAQARFVTALPPEKYRFDLRLWK